jgi:hypothetical protein
VHSCNAMQLPGLSDEQAVIVDDVVKCGCNVAVDAVAGSGKSTTILACMDARRRGQVVGTALVLTYNAKLKSETRVKVRALGLGAHVQVHSYHSAALRFYEDPTCRTDEGLLRVVTSDARPEAGVLPVAPVTLLVVDEAQDMTPLYFRLVARLLRDVCAPGAQLLVLGDTRQSIYGFKGSDARFLGLAPDLPLSTEPAEPAEPREWRRRQLTTTYRLTPHAAGFVNDQLLMGVPPLLRSSASASSDDWGDGGGSKVRYLVCNAFQEAPTREVQRWLGAGLLPRDIYVLAPTMRAAGGGRSSPVRKLENRLVRAGVPCYASSSDEDTLDEDVTRGKVVFATFHQVKGLERAAVLVFGFDASYTDFFERGLSAAGAGAAAGRRPAPNPVYVAATRSTRHLSLVHHADNLPLPSVCVATLGRHADVVCSTGKPALALGSGRPPTVGATGRRGMSGMSGMSGPMGPVAVTDLLRHLPEDVLQAAAARLLPRPVSPTAGGAGGAGGAVGGEAAPMCRVTTGGGTVEDVTALTGIALPAMYEARSRGTCSALRHAVLNASQLPAGDTARIGGLARRPLSALGVPDFLYIANAYNTLVTGYQCKLQQIDRYDWVDEARAAAALAVLSTHLPLAHAGAMRFEAPLSPAEVGGRMLRGVADVVDEACRTLWELKCVAGALSTEHVLQLAAYAYLHDLRPHPPSPSPSPSPAGGGTSTSTSTSLGATRGWAYKLLNVLTGEVVTLAYDRDAARDALVVLMDAKSGGCGGGGEGAGMTAEQRAAADAAFIAGLSALRTASVDPAGQPGKPGQPGQRFERASMFMACADDECF